MESDRQLEVSKKWLKAFQGQLEMVKENRSSYSNSLQYKVALDCAQSLIDELTEEIDNYENNT